MINCNYIHIPKTGGHSIKEKLGIPWRSSKYAHRTALEVIESTSREKWDSSFNVVTVRNPYSWIFSLWLNYGQSKNLEDWVIEDLPDFRWGGPQYNWTHDNDGNNLMDLILHFENMNQWVKLQHLGKSTKRYRGWNFNMNVYPNLKELIYERYKKDFEYFGYDKL